MELQHGNRIAPGAVAKRIKNSSGGKSVVVLKKGDVKIRNKIVYMPNTIEMAQLKKPGKGQFWRQVPIDSGMTAEQIEKLLKECFPCLEGKSFYCAAAVDNRTKLDFHGSPCIWDGSSIKRKIKGNSALYIFAEESGRPSIFDSHTCISEQAAPIWSQGQCVSQGSGDLVQLMGMGSLEPEIQGPPITGLLSNYFVHSSVAPAMTSEVNQEFLFLSETNSSPQDENPLNGRPNTGTHSTTSYLCPNNASQMFPTLSDSWHQELSELDSANVPSSDVDSGWQDDGNGLPCDRDLVSSDLDRMLQLFGDQNFTSSSMNIVDGQSSMEIQPEGTVHQDQVGADCNGNSPTEEFDSLTTATDLNIKSRNSSQECDLDHSVVQRITPPSGSVEGGYPFVIALSEPLPGQVNFGEAKFHGVATVNLEKLNNHTFSGTVPRCHLTEPGIVEVTVMTQTGQHLGTTSFEYVDELTKIAKEITVDHGKQAKFFSKLSEEHKVLSGSSLQSKQQHSLQFLQFLVYTASQTGAKNFIEIIFSTSAGQIVFDSYKDRTCLPEDVARASGHDELANYLQDLTTRFSKEPEFSRKEAHVIDWSELEAAAIAAQTQGCLTEEKSSDDSSENNSDTDYFADVETSSINSSELSRSTSEDDTSKPNSRDKTKASAHQSISSIGKWAFAGNGTMGKIGQIKEGMKQKSCVLILRYSHFDSSLPEVVKGLDYTLAFHLAIGSKNIPCHLHTVNERFLVLRESITRQPTMSFCKLHPYPDVLKESTFVKNNKGFISKTAASKQRHWNQLNEDIVAELGTLMPIEKDIAVEWKSSGTFGKEFGAHTHCDLWVFTSAFRPTRKTFFVYFADRRNALPHSYFFEDEDCESQIRCWKWKRSGNNSLKFTESVKEKKLPPGREKSQLESDVDLPVTYIVRDKQAQTPSESGICLSWMHAMMHHCWTTESTEKASNITILDHFLGPLGTDLMMSSGSRNDDSNKEKLNICQPVVSSGVGNTKINHEKWRMVESVFIDQTDCKIKGNEAKETKVEADSSKTERRAAPGKSLPAFTVDDSEIRRLSSATIALRTPWVMLSGVGNDDAIKKAKLGIILVVYSQDQLIDCKSKDTRGNENEVQAEFARAHDSAIRNSRTPSIISLSVADDDDTEFLSPSGLYEQEFLKGSSSSLRSDDDSKKPQLSIYHQVATSSVEKSKKNFKMCRMDAPILKDLTDGQIKGSVAKESKVQSDSSKPQTTADADESLPTFVKSCEVNLTKSQFNEMGVKAHFSKAKTSKKIFAKWARVASFLGDLTDSTIIEVNMGEVMKVQADSSNTQTTIENLDEEVEHPGEVLNFRREFSGDADSGCSTVDGTSNRVRKPTSTLQVEFGRKHYRMGKFPQIKGTGGGTGIVDMERSSSYHDCLFKAIELFFPNSISRYGTLAEMETPYLANFRLHKYKEEGFTVGRFKEIRTKMNSPRIYLGTKPKTQTDSRPQRNSPSSDTLYGTEVNKVESSTRPASEADSGFQDHLSDISSDLDSMLQFLEDPNLSLMSNVDGQSPMEVTGLTEEKSSDDSSENNSNTDYFADVETSIDSSELSRSTSEDDTSEPYFREKTKASAHQSIFSIVEGAFAENGTMDKIRQNILEGVKQKHTVLILEDSHFDSRLPEAVKGLNYTLAFQLATGSKNISRHLHTANERFLASRENIIRQPTMSFCKLHPDVLIESSFVKNNNDYILRIDASKQSNQLNEGIFAKLRNQIPIEKAIPVEWKSSDISVKQFGGLTHCDLWVFTSAFRPTRKTLFVYFADRRDALPHSYFFEDEDCESQIRCWKWKRSENNSWKFTERLEAEKLPPGREKSQMESHADLPVTYIVRDKQALRLSWMHAMMHHCWTIKSTKKTSNITIFVASLGNDGILEDTCGPELGIALAKVKSLTTLHLTINSNDGILERTWETYLYSSLAEIKSLTTLHLTINSNDGIDGWRWAHELGYGLAKIKSLTTLHLTINSNDGIDGCMWAEMLGYSLAEIKSLTTLHLTINSNDVIHGCKWAEALSYGLAEIKSLTTLHLTINSNDGIDGCRWAEELGYGLAEIKSQTTVTFYDGISACMWREQLFCVLERIKSLTTLHLKINGNDGIFKRRITDVDLAHGRFKRICAHRLHYGLAESKSLTKVCLKANNRSSSLDELMLPYPSNFDGSWVNRSGYQENAKKCIASNQVHIITTTKAHDLSGMSYYTNF